MRKLNESGRKAALFRVLGACCALALASGALTGLAGCSCSEQRGKDDAGGPSAKTEEAKDVPNVVGMTKEDAQRVVSAAGFTVGALTEEESETVAIGMVMRQEPKAHGQARSAIDLVVSKGVKKAPARTSVPQLAGMTQTQAEEALAAAKLVAKAENPVYKEGVEAGKVFAQSVAEGTSVDEGTVVGFTAALGKEVVAVPSVAGMGKSDAAAVLADAGFNVDTVEAYNSSVEAGKVIGQNPNPKIQCVRGTTVTLVVSKGAAPDPVEQVPVPDLATLSLPQAQGVLESAGLVCKHIGPEYGYTIAQSIAAGTRVDRGTTVTVTLEGLAEDEKESMI